MIEDATLVTRKARRKTVRRETSLAQTQPHLRPARDDLSQRPPFRLPPPRPARPADGDYDAELWT